VAGMPMNSCWCVPVQKKRTSGGTPSSGTSRSPTPRAAPQARRPRSRHACGRGAAGASPGCGDPGSSSEALRFRTRANNMGLVVGRLKE
jgi:hypothetical protein